MMYMVLVERSTRCTGITHTLERSYTMPNYADSRFPLIKPDDWAGGKSWRKTSVHKSSTFTFAVYTSPSLPDRAKYPPSRPPQQIQTHRLPFHIVCV